MAKQDPRGVASRFVKTLEAMTPAERYATLAVTCMLLGCMPEAKAFTDRADTAPPADKLPV